VGDNNVSAVAKNANGTDMQTWVRNVTGAALPKPTPNVTHTPTPPTPVPTPSPMPTPKPFGFEVGFAIAGLFAVAYLGLRRRE